MREAATWLLGLVAGVVVPLACGAGWVIATVDGSLVGAVVALAAWPLVGRPAERLWRTRAGSIARDDAHLLRVLSVCAFAVGTAAAVTVAIVVG